MITHNIRVACKAVADMADHVRIRYDVIEEYATGLPVHELASPELDAERHYLGQGDDTAAFFLILDSVNFGSGYFPHLRKRPGMSGYFTVASALTDRFRAQGPMTADELARLTTEDCAVLFGQDPANPVSMELMGLFARALNDLGNYVTAQFSGEFAALIRAGEGGAEKLIRLLIYMPLFRDVSDYKNISVPFYKRAQLLVADLALAFDGKGLGAFHDLDELTIFADNLVPHVLRSDGVLAYDDDLGRRIDAGELIPSGSPEEIEIRACALHAVELMSQALQKAGNPVPPMKLDYLLWNRGQQPYYKARPRHRARSVFY